MDRAMMFRVEVRVEVGEPLSWLLVFAIGYLVFASWGFASLLSDLLFLKSDALCLFFFLRMHLHRLLTSQR